jgi:hypothetical protein
MRRGRWCLQLLDDLSVAGSVFVTSGTFHANSNTINIAADWVNFGGDFVPGSSTVTFIGTNQQIPASETFANLVKSVTSADTLTFGQKSTMTVTGTIRLKGAAGNLLSLRSSKPTTRWFINPAGSGTRDIEYLDIQDSYNISGSVLNAYDGTHTNSGNNVQWRFRQRLLSPIMLVD